MTPQKDHDTKRKVWEVPELVRLDAGRAENNGLGALDGSGPGVNQS